MCSVGAGYFLGGFFFDGGPLTFSSDKMSPFGFVSMGAFVGFRLGGFKKTLYSHMWYLVPISQGSSVLRAGWSNTSELDRGLFGLAIPSLRVVLMRYRFENARWMGLLVLVLYVPIM